MSFHPTPRLGVIALAAAIALAGTACERQLMRAPVMFDQTAADPFDELPPERRNTATTIFFATNRVADPDNTQEPYGRGRAAALMLGRLDVEIGDDLGWQDLIDRTIGENGRAARPPLRIDPPHQYGPLLTTAPPRVVRQSTGSDEEDDDLHVRFMPRQDPGRGAFRFAQALDDEMAATNHPEVYVYIHGYRNSFADAAETAASLHHYSGRRGAVVCFSWPSQKHLLDYLEDRESAQFAVSDLRQLLVFLADHTAAERIHLVAHSMGSFLTSNALREMRLIGFDESPRYLQNRFKIDNVVLVAPDIDADVLQKRFFREGFHQVPRKLTIYTSPEDKALVWARRLLYGHERAGAITGDLLTETQKLWLKAHRDTVAVIDITGQKTYGLGHSHHTENPGVASDLLLLLAHDLDPADRGLVQTRETGVWRFPEGYTDEVRRIAERVYPLVDSDTTNVAVSPPPTRTYPKNEDPASRQSADSAHTPQAITR
ncbi:MAG: alpha/beta fold hydrolase [Planctomycetota bacterium]